MDTGARHVNMQIAGVGAMGRMQRAERLVSISGDRAKQEQSVRRVHEIISTSRESRRQNDVLSRGL